MRPLCFLFLLFSHCFSLSTRTHGEFVGVDASGLLEESSALRPHVDVTAFAPQAAANSTAALKRAALISVLSQDVDGEDVYDVAGNLRPRGAAHATTETAVHPVATAPMRSSDLLEAQLRQALRNDEHDDARGPTYESPPPLGQEDDQATPQSGAAGLIRFEDVDNDDDDDVAVFEGGGDRGDADAEGPDTTASTQPRRMTQLDEAERRETVAAYVEHPHDDLAVGSMPPLLADLAWWAPRSQSQPQAPPACAACARLSATRRGVGAALGVRAAAAVDDDDALTQFAVAADEDADAEGNNAQLVDDGIVATTARGGPFLAYAKKREEDRHSLDDVTAISSEQALVEALYHKPDAGFLSHVPSSGLVKDAEDAEWARWSHDVNYRFLQWSGAFPDMRPFRPHFKTSVGVSLTVLNIFDLNQNEESFGATLIIRRTWQDSRLAFDPGVMGVHQFQSCLLQRDFMALWTPAMYLRNSIQPATPINDLRNHVSSLRNDGRVWYGEVWNGKLSTEFDFFYYPFDVQRLEIVFSVLEQNRNQVALYPFANRGIVFQHFPLMGWEILGSWVDAKGQGIESHLRYTILVRRTPAPLVLTLIVPTLVVAMLAYLTFFLDPSNSDVRDDIAVTVFLALVLQVYCTLAHAPKMSHPGIFHFFILLIVCLVSLSIFAGFSGRIYERLTAWTQDDLDDTERQAKIMRVQQLFDRIGRWVGGLMILILIFGVVFFLAMQQRQADNIIASQPHWTEASRSPTLLSPADHEWLFGCRIGGVCTT